MFRVTFHITEECNMACTYCYEFKKNKVIQLTTATKLIDEVISYKTTGESFLRPYFEQNNEIDNDTEVELDFIGGEITLYMDLVESITDYWFRECAKHRLVKWFYKTRIVLETNGTTYFNEDVQHFLNKYKEKISAPITIDGCEECHDKCRRYKDGRPSFYDVDRAVKAEKERIGDVPNSKMTFTPETFKYILDSCKYLYSLGYQRARMNLDITQEITPVECEQYKNELIKVADWILDNKIPFIITPFTYNYNSVKEYSSCGMTGVQIAIDVYGNLYNCFRLSESSLQDKYRPIGNIFNKTLDMDFVTDFLNRISAHNNYQCQGCPIIHSCEECPADNYYYKGDFFESVNNCGETVAEAQANKYFIEKAKATDYPYFRDIIDNLNNEYDPNFNYYLYQKN